MYYIIFFNSDNQIIKAHRSVSYPKVGEIVYSLKLLEQNDINSIEELMMDIISEEEFNKLKG